MPVATPLALAGQRWSEASAPSVLRAIAFVWAWPWSAYEILPLGFGLMGIVTVLFVTGLMVRKDWRGAVAALVWSLLWGWVVLAYVITDS